jgi:broad specificity phosphatase PhoE
VQAHPSAVAFPGGESLRDTQARAVDAIRERNRTLGDEATWALVSHGDVIKAVLADALGMHLDLFQRIQADPCSVSVVRYTTLRPFVVRMNDTGGAVDDLVPPKRRRRTRRTSSDAVVGGGAGADAADA